MSLRTIKIYTLHKEIVLLFECAHMQFCHPHLLCGRRMDRSTHTHTHTYTCAHIRYAGMAMTLAEKERKDLRQACCQGSLLSEPQGFWTGII